MEPGIFLPFSSSITIDFPSSREINHQIGLATDSSHGNVEFVEEIQILTKIF